MEDDAALEGQQVADALGALGAWLLAEDAYQRGGVLDEVLNYLQDQLDRLLGPQATPVAEEFLRRYAGAGGGLADLARDRSALVGLLALIDSKRRPGFELEWAVDSPTLSADRLRRPEALLVMAEYGVEDPVWDRPRGGRGPVSLSQLEVSDSLVQRLRGWNETFERSALPDTEWAGPEAHAGWVRQGLALAHELQLELPDVDVRYFHADDDRPLRSSGQAGV